MRGVVTIWFGEGLKYQPIWVQLSGMSKMLENHSLNLFNLDVAAFLFHLHRQLPSNAIVIKNSTCLIC